MMGCFDSVKVSCPECGAWLDFQSKAGECDFINYRRHSVPTIVAKDLDREIVECEGCGKEYMLIIQNPPSYPRTAMFMVTKEPSDVYKERGFRFEDEPEEWEDEWEDGDY